MAKGQQKKSRENRKPKKEKVKVLATSNSNAGKDPVIGGKAVSGGPSGKSGGKAARPH